MKTVVFYGIDDRLQIFLREIICHELQWDTSNCLSVAELASQSSSENIVIFHVDNLVNPEFKKWVLSQTAVTKIALGRGSGVVITQVEYLPFPLRPSEVLAKLTAADSNHRPSVPKEYFPVALSFFSYLQELPCEIFIRLGKKEEDFRFLKKFDAGHLLELTELEQMAQKGITHLFIQHALRDKFFLALGERADQQVSVERPAPLEIHHTINLHSDIQSILSEIIQLTQINDKVVELANRSILSMAQTIKSSSKLFSLLTQLLQNKSSFQYKHCFLNTIFCYEIMQRMDYGKTSRLDEQFEMMSFVTFFHDILLKDEKLVRIKNKKDFLRLDLTAPEKDLVKHHAKLIADLLAEKRGTPAEAAKIIKHHHGMTNGIDFPSSYNASIPVLAIMFIVSEFFVFQLLDPTENQGKLAKIFTLADEEFTLPSYHKFVKHFRAIFSGQ